VVISEETTGFLLFRADLTLYFLYGPRVRLSKICTQTYVLGLFFNFWKLKAAFKLKYDAMKVLGNGGHAFLTPKIDGNECLASRFGLFNPVERYLGTHWIGNWVGPRSSQEEAVKREGLDSE
jgi:hypothetical protein